MTDQSSYLVFLTFQPNTAHGAPLRIRPNPGDRTPQGQIWAFVDVLFYHTDQRRSGCQKPGLLSPRDRLQGFAVIEKEDGNAHVHVIVTCRDAVDQWLTALQLFAYFDTVPVGRSDPRDDAWQRDAWQLLVDRDWLCDQARTRTFSPFLARYAPGGTAMVQIVRNDHDRRRVCRYISKELSGTSMALASRGERWDRKSDFAVKELRDFHSETGRLKSASHIRIDPQTGAQTLDLDDLNPWRWGGKRVR